MKNTNKTQAVKRRVPKDGPAGGEGRRLSLWHTAFVEAMHRELKPWENHLSFEAEHLLNAAPLAMDLLIIKKDPALVIDNKIAVIFRTHNIIEYKSPWKNVSIFDFNKVCGYAHIYSALQKAPLEDITVTFIADPYPRGLFAYLRRLGYAVEETWAGIYSIRYAKIAVPAMQFIERKRLSTGDNLWLKSLGDRLEAADLDRVLKECQKDEEPAVKGAYLDLLLTVNMKTVKEMAMRKRVTLEYLLDIFKEAGQTDQIREWEESIEKRAEERVTAQVEERVRTQEERAAAERERLMRQVEQERRENERLRREIERLRSGPGRVAFT